MKVTELIAGIRADKVTMWVERGSLRYRGRSRAVEKWLPQIRDNREAIAAELRCRGTSPVMSGGCRLGLGKERPKGPGVEASGAVAGPNASSVDTAHQPDCRPRNLAPAA
jgi:hypothetical protein